MLTALARWWLRATTPNDVTFPLNDADAWASFLDGATGTAAGEHVSKRKALSLSPVWQAVSMISGDCAKLPLNVFRRLENGGRELAVGHPAAKLIHLRGRANSELTAHRLLRRLYVSSLLWNNGYLWIERDGPFPIALYNLLPDRTRPERDRDGRLWYVTEIGGDLHVLHADDVIHVEGVNVGDDAAPDLVQQAREDFGVALAARSFTSRFFSNGAHAGGILQVPVGATKEARDRVEKAINEQHTNTTKAFKTLVLRDGFKWFSTTVDPDKAKLIDLDEAKVRDVARWFNLSPSKLGVRESVSYNSEEAAKQNYFDSTLSYWLIAVGAEANAKLLLPSETATHFIDHNINALLWADSQTRSTIANAGIQTGRFTIDETRAWENLNPLPNGVGAIPLRPVNVTPNVVPATADAGEDTRAAHTRLLRATVLRIARRLGTQAARHLPNRLAEWRSKFPSEHRSACEEMLTDVLAVCHSVGVAREWDATTAVNHLFRRADEVGTTDDPQQFASELEKTCRLI